MRTATRAAVALTLALTVVVGAAGAAWATFRSPASSSATVTTLTLAPPAATPVSSTCTVGMLGLSRTLTVTFPDSPSEATVSTRPASTPAKVLTYSATGAYSSSTILAAGSTTAGPVNATSGTTNQINLTANVAGTRTWTVAVTTAYSGWTSSAVSYTGFSC